MGKNLDSRSFPLVQYFSRALPSPQFSNEATYEFHPWTLRGRGETETDMNYCLMCSESDNRVVFVVIFLRCGSTAILSNFLFEICWHGTKKKENWKFQVKYWYIFSIQIFLAANSSRFSSWQNAKLKNFDENFCP